MSKIRKATLRRSYSENQKYRILYMVRQGNSIKKVAEELSIPYSTAYKIVKDHKANKIEGKAAEPEEVAEPTPEPAVKAVTTAQYLEAIVLCFNEIKNTITEINRTQTEMHNMLFKSMIESRKGFIDRLFDR